MNFLKKINFLVITWALETLDKKVDENFTNSDSKQIDQDSSATEPKIDFAVGGQAVIEGVMMRSPNSIAIAVRKLSGDIKVQKKHYQTLTQRYKWLNFPIIRGVINLFEMMIIGTKAINFSASESIDEELKEESEKSRREKIFETIMFILSFIFAMALSIFMFKFIHCFCIWCNSFLNKCNLCS